MECGGTGGEWSSGFSWLRKALDGSLPPVGHWIVAWAKGGLTMGIRKLLVVAMVVGVIIGSTPGAAYAFGVEAYDRYSVMGDYANYATTSSCITWLWNTRSTWYKGSAKTTYPNEYYVVRYRQQQLDPRPSSSWLGYGRTNNSAFVYEWQRALAYLGYNSWSNLDGLWGPTTDSATRSFQSANGISPDGIVGPKTWGYGTCRD